MNAHYTFTYIVRVWRESEANGTGWRFSVQDTVTGERHGFSELAVALGFIASEMAAGSAAGDDASGGRSQRDGVQVWGRRS